MSPGGQDLAEVGRRQEMGRLPPRGSGIDLDWHLQSG